MVSSVGVFGQTISEIGSVVLDLFLFWFGGLALWLWWSCLRQATAQWGRGRERGLLGHQYLVVRR